MNDEITPLSTAASLATGTVLGKSRNSGWRVQVGDVTYNAVLAAGCFLEPSKGDMTLVACTGTKKAYIIQVLERSEDTAATLQLPRTSALMAGAKGAGRLRIEASELALGGGVLRTAFKRVLSLAETVENRAGMLRERYTRRFEEVEGVKDSKIGRLRCLVGGLLSLRGDMVDVKAEKRVKVDGEAVDIG